jgi:6-pyruvoyltetrahydropterin/6-carboxytetrahydropterin synthase
MMQSGVMTYRICKSFEVESGHMLMKHPGACRFPHGHSRRIEIVLTSRTLDANDMVCDFKALKLAVHECIMRFDHSMAINSQDPIREALGGVSQRVVVFEGADPTTEIMARSIYEYVQTRIVSGGEFTDTHGAVYRLPEGMKVERVRVWETSSTWAEYSADD